MPRITILLVGIGVLAISTAAPLIKLLPHVPPVVIAAYRLAFAAIVLVPVASLQARTQPGRLTRSHWWIIVAAGVCLALHFAMWITSLRYTSVASSVTLVTLNPLFLALACYLLWDERLTWRLGLGISFAIIGSACIVWSDAHDPVTTSASTVLFGDGLALCGALMASAYLLCGRVVRPHMMLSRYVGLVYTCAALVLILTCLLLGLPLHGYSGQSYLFLALLALIPQVVGHTILNWSLAHLSPTLVGLAILGEPVGATFLAFAFLGESVSSFQGVGVVLILTGISLGQSQGNYALSPANARAKISPS